MSTVKYLLINHLDATIPASFVHPDMRENFQTTVTGCGEITRHLSWGDLKLMPTDGNLLRPVAYNLLVDALNHDPLLNQLKDNSHRLGYWFFNLFLVPCTMHDAPASIHVPTVDVFKGDTRSVTVLPIRSIHD